MHKDLEPPPLGGFPFVDNPGLFTGLNLTPSSLFFILITPGFGVVEYDPALEGFFTRYYLDWVPTCPE
jgi:hypothetical protein